MRYLPFKKKKKKKTFSDIITAPRDPLDLSIYCYQIRFRSYLSKIT